MHQPRPVRIRSSPARSISKPSRPTGINGQSRLSVDAATKVAFVIYYMKLHTVNVSLVSQVSKPTHNGVVTTYGYADYTPGNPWDATKDDADNAATGTSRRTSWYVCRVTGWFLNEQPSGRAGGLEQPVEHVPGRPLGDAAGLGEPCGRPRRPG